MSFAVVQPGARSRNRSFAQGAGIPDDSGPSPEGIFAYAACRNGSFHRSLRSLPANADTLAQLKHLLAARR
jgi:hypothetical protein